ncbi:MAG: flagellar hook-basal body complex protein FliE [Clostridiales Family XIII bacterium]|jgi:flagellar hook-basal body complex protein FliE|nr:flagellar hook-basal body complex protein FliE [Clostridiales Family XIII bacterium]
MFIVPMHSSIDLGRINAQLSEMGLAEEAAATGAAPYKSEFRQALEGLINDVEETEAISDMDAYKLSIGELDDPHTAMINAAKAELTLSTMVQIRNKVLDAYSEVMRISI